MNSVIPSQTITNRSEVSTVPLIEACGLPEIGSELVGKSLRVARPDAGPYAITGSTITISPEVAADFRSSAALLREALELMTIATGAEPRWAHRIVAHATAAIYSETVLHHHSAATGLSPWMLDGAGERLVKGDTTEAMAAEIASFLAKRDQLEDCPAGEIRAASRALPVSHPTEVLLTLGGDHRQVVDWEAGTNSYGLSPRPVPWRSQFGSSTASSPSPRAFEAARALRHDLVAAAVEDVVDDSVEAVVDSNWRGIISAFGIDSSAEVVLTPSGTDAEFVALALAAAIHGPVVSVVVAPDEIGSGSLNAAQGRNFSTLSPFATGLEVGATLPGFEGLVTEMLTVEVRDDRGELRDPAEVEEEMHRAIRSTPGPILVHVVEGTKTGVRLPRLETVKAWDEEFGERMTVVVDAAQMRIDQATVRSHFDAGHIVFVSGSKFFGGPPFSGAVLVPAEIARRADGACPVGLAQYFSRHDIPPELAGLRSAAGTGTNFGLVLRWAAALAEITSFLNASPEIRDEVLRMLAQGVRGVLESAPHVRIVESPYSKMPTPDDRGLDDLPTIFTFEVLDRTGRPLGMDAAREVHRLLASDLTDDGFGLVGQEPSSRRLFHQAFHLGQPVAIHRPGGEVSGALRVAIGAPTLSQIVFDVTRGRNWRDRLDLELADVQGAINKISLLVDTVAGRPGRADEGP